MALNDYQYSYRGLTMGDGTDYDFIELSGLYSLDVRVADRANVRSHGLMPGLHRANAGTIRGSVEVVGTPGAAALGTAFDALMDVLNPDQYELGDPDDDKFAFKFPEEDERFVLARPTRRRAQRKAGMSEFGLIPVEFEMVKYGPRIYDATLDSSNKTGTGAFTATNGGDAYAYPIITFDPDGSGDAKLTNSTTGDVIELDGAGTTSGLICDMHRFINGYGHMLIIYRSASSYYSSWVTPRDPFRLAPGLNNLNLDTGDSVNVQWYDTRM